MSLLIRFPFLLATIPLSGKINIYLCKNILYKVSKKYKTWDVNDVVLIFLLLTLDKFHFSGAFIIDFKQVYADWFVSFFETF